MSDSYYEVERSGPSQDLSFTRVPPLRCFPTSRSYVSLSSIPPEAEQRSEAVAERNLLIAVDDQPESIRALEWTLQNLYRRGDLLHLLHVAPEPATARAWTGVYAPPDEEAAEDEEINEAKHMVQEKLVPLLLKARVPFRLHVVVAALDTGTVSTVIAEEAAAISAQVVVMASGPKSRLHDLWYGSVGSSALRSVPHKVPVVLVR